MDELILTQLPRLLNETEEEKEDKICCTYYGIIIYVMGAFAMALGVNLQKYAINKMHLKYPNPEDHIGFWKRPLSILGVVMYAASGGLLSVALIFAAQSQLAPLMSVVIVSNAILARILLGEPIAKRDLLAIGIIIAAVIITTVFAPQSTEKYGRDELVALYGQPGFYAFVSILIMLLVGFYIANKFVLGKVDSKPDKISAALIDCAKADIDYVPKYQEEIFAFSYGAQAGLWGGLCVTMMKSAISIIIEAFEEDIIVLLTSGLSYGLLAVLIACWTMQLYWINLGLERYPAVFVVSIEAVLNELIAVTGGVLYFKEYEKFDLVSGSMFCFGLFLGVLGIMLFATRDNFSDEDAFETCFPIQKIENDPNKREKPVDISRRPSWKVQDSMNRRGGMPHFDEDGNIIAPASIQKADSLRSQQDVERTL